MHWQITVAAARRDRLCPEDADRLAAMGTIARVAGPSLRLWAIADEHAHILVAADRATAGHLASAVARALRRLPGVPELAAARFTAVNGRDHLTTLVGYVLRQSSHHGIRVHPARWNGSCLPDLVGARRLPGHRAEGLAADLPRVDIAALALRGVGVEPLAPLDLPRIRDLGPARPFDASAAAIGRGALTGSERIVIAAREAYAALCVGAGVPAAEARRIAGIPGRSWTRLAAGDGDPAWMATIRARLALDIAIARAIERSATSDHALSTPVARPRGL
jgi:hypothetical protein